jgi:hypothetical protein
MNAKNTSAVYLAMAAMFMLYGMSAVALNLAAPLGNVWMAQPGIAGSKTLGMMGNMMSFCANIFIGIPTGVMLQRIGYKKTSLIAIALGFVGMLIQWSSGWLGSGALLGGVAASFFVYLVGFNEIEKSHKSAKQSLLTLCVYAKSLGVDVYTVIKLTKLDLWRVAYSENKFVAVCK